MEKKSTEKRQQRLLNSYQPFQYNQPGGVSRLGWIIIGIIIVVIYFLLEKNIFGTSIMTISTTIG
jgi:hypothetical protein